MYLHVHSQNYSSSNFLSINKNTYVMENEMSFVSEQLVF